MNEESVPLQTDNLIEGKKKGLKIMPRYFGGFRYEEGVRADVMALEKGKDTEVNGVTREQVMEDIGKIIEWCYDHGVNYLSILKKAFPVYEWHSIKCDYDKPSKYIAEILQSHDFIWSYQSALVTARSRKRKKFFRIYWIAEILYYNHTNPTPHRVFLDNCTKIIRGGSIRSK